MENNTKIIHIATEVVLLGAVVFYFNGQIKTLKNEIRELKQKIEDDNTEKNKHFNNLYQLADNTRNGMMQMARAVPMKEMQQPPKISGIRHRKPIVRPSSEQEPAQDRSFSSSSSQEQFKVMPEQGVDEDIKPEDLDAELGEELGDLHEDESMEQESSEEAPDNKQSLPMQVKAMNHIKKK